MSYNHLRSSVRTLRLYWKSAALIRECVANLWRALVAPLLPGSFDLVFRDGYRVQVPRGSWELIPTICRLWKIGAQTVIDLSTGSKRIIYRSFTFESPMSLKREPYFLREIFEKDIYRVAANGLYGCRVVDIGAYIGDSAICFASLGAQVWAVEPSELRVGFLRRNIAANGFDGVVTVLPYGASDDDGMKIVGGESYRFRKLEKFLDELPRDIDMLKMDCEGCEYNLVANEEFMDHLSPKRIALEYHQGMRMLREHLECRGYSVETTGDPQVGYLYATLRG